MNEIIPPTTLLPILRNEKTVAAPSPPVIYTPYDYMHAATSDNTRKAYLADVRHFETWGGKLPTTSQQLITYLHAFATQLNPRTLNRHITALKQWHTTQGLADPSQHPSVKKTLSGIQRIHGQPKEKATPLLPDDLIKMVTYLNQQPSLSACRDNALLQIGFFGAFRRSELVNICYEDLNFQKQGIEIFIPHSKTDQERQGQYCAVPYGHDVLCPVSSLENWLKRSTIISGPLFRKINRWEQLSDAPLTPAAINTILKKIAHAAHVKQALQLSGHSMRRGFTTAASHEGVALHAIMQQGRWQQVNTVMEYIEAAQRFNENAADIMLKKLKNKNT